MSTGTTMVVAFLALCVLLAVIVRLADDQRQRRAAKHSRRHPARGRHRAHVQMLAEQ